MKFSEAFPRTGSSSNREIAVSRSFARSSKVSRYVFWGVGSLS